VSSSAARDTRHIGSCRGWITEALNIVELAVPIENNSYRRQVKKIGEGVGNLDDHVASIASILHALLSDMDAGLIGNGDASAPGSSNSKPRLGWRMLPSDRRQLAADYLLYADHRSIGFNLFGSDNRLASSV
jgi:hypothetical protein